MSNTESIDIYDWEYDAVFTNNTVLAAWHGDDEADLVATQEPYEWIVDEPASETPTIQLDMDQGKGNETVPTQVEQRYVHVADISFDGVAFGFIPALFLGGEVNARIPEQAPIVGVLAGSAIVALTTAALSLYYWRNGVIVTSRPPENRQYGRR